VLPEIGAALGLGGAAGAVADAGIGAAGALDAGLATDLAAGAGDLGAITAAGEFAGGAGEALAFAPDVAAGGSAFDILGPGLGADVLADPAVAGYTTAPSLAADAGLTSASSGAPSLASGPGASTTPSGFAATDAELAGAATGTAPAATAAATPGITSQLGSALSSPWTKLALAGVPLALTLGMGEAQLPTSAQQLQQQATALSQQGQSDLASARAGTLNAGQTATLGNMRNDLVNSWRQALFNQGVQNPEKDTRWPQILAQIDSQVTQQTATMIQQNITNALAETGQAASALTAIAQMQFQADQNFTNALINATKSLGLAAGLSSGTKITIGG
jgi:hypothetical protein